MPHLRLSRVLLSTFSPSYPPPSSLPRSTSSFGDINPSPSPFLCRPRKLSLTLLFPPPHSHENFFLFYAALCRCSCLLTHSLLRVFLSPAPSFTRGVCRAALGPPFRARGKRSRSPIHPRDFSLSHLSNFALPPRAATPFICLSIPSRAPSRAARHLHHISNLARILSAAVSQTLKSFLGN